jgi:hypothetical protein
VLTWYQRYGDVERYEMLAAIELIVAHVEEGIPAQPNLACGIGPGAKAPVL